jgi:hypothetical protein
VHGRSERGAVMSTWVSKNTHELVEGDVVRCYGGRFLIDQEIKVSESHPKDGRGGECRYTKARYLGPVEEGVEPDSMMMAWVRRDGGTWSIQGNALATWAVEA